MLQCLLAKDSGNDLDSATYDQKLANILRREIAVLQEQSDFAREIFRDGRKAAPIWIHLPIFLMHCTIKKNRI